MRTLAETALVISLIRPVVATSTVTGTGVQIDVGEWDDAIAVVNLGVCLTTTETCIVTIEASATLNGTYTVLQTFGTATGTSDATIAAGPVNLTGYSFVRAVATIAGTTPSFAIDVVLLVRPVIGKSGLNSLTFA